MRKTGFPISKFKLLGLIFLISCSPSLFPEKIPLQFRHITIENGLSQNTINCMFQDRKGFMWFGTQDGLNRYDGYSFTIFKYNANDPTSISDIHIHAIVEDQSGNLWIGTEDGLNRFDYASGNFHRYYPDPQDTQTLSHNYIHSLLIDQSKILWIGTEKGLNRYDSSSDSFINSRNNPEYRNAWGQKPVNCLFTDRSGKLWLGSEAGLFQKADSREIFLQLADIADDPNSLSDNRINCIYEDRQGFLWIGTKNGLNRFDRAGRKFERYLNSPEDRFSLSDNYIYTIGEDLRGNLYIGTNNNLCLFDRSKNYFIRFSQQANDPNALNDDVIRSIFKDKSGMLWVGTYIGGLNLNYPYAKQFLNYHMDPNSTNSLNTSNIRCFYEDPDGILWIGTHGGGINRYDRTLNRFSHYRHDPRNANSLSSNIIRAIRQDSFGILWIGTDDRGVNTFNPKTGKFIRYWHDPADRKSLNHNDIRSIIIDHLGIVWIGTYGGGLDKFDKKNNCFVHYKNDPANPASLSYDFIYSLYEDRAGTLWVGTDGGGLNRFDREKETFTCYKNDPKNSNSLSNNYILAIYEDRSGVLWVGTDGNFNRMNRKDNTFIVYSEKDGLPNNVVYGILEDQEGNLWLSTNKGLSRFSPKDANFKNYDQTDNLQGNEFSGGAYYKNRKGEMFFGGLNGFNSFFPRNIKDNPYIPPVYIIDFKLFNQSVPIGPWRKGRSILKKTITETNAIVLSYKDLIFSFDYIALNYNIPEKNRFSYKMEGFDEDWNQPGNNRTASYMNMPHGTYVFKVKGSNNDGIWNETGVALEITITPPFWQTWWFKTLLILFILFLILFIYRLRIRQLKSREEELEQLVNERTRQLENSNKLLFAANKELEKLSLVASETDNAVVIMDIDGNIEWLNEGFIRMYKYTLEQLITEKGINIKNSSNNPHILEYFAGCLQQKKSIVYETSCLNRDGERFWSQTTLTPIMDDSGQVKKVIAIDTEITKIKEAEEAADRANQSKSEFLARMSHEIRTPMNGVIGFSDMLLDTNLNEEQIDYARTISRSGEALITLLNDILDFSKIEAGELVLDPIDFDPELTAFDICDLIQPRITTKPVEIFCRIGDNVPAFIKADPGRFRQVIINLLGNAIKFTEHGSIELSLEVTKEEDKRLQLLIKIKDTGIGIPEDKLENIFEVFQQADGSTTRKYGGTGLGLSICRQIAHLMEGNVRVESQLGQGSTFHFSCWVEKSTKEAEKHSSALAGKRILIVDDNSTNLEILSHVLLHHKMEVVELTDPRRVIQLIKKHHQNDKAIDICIMDIQMPGFSGYDVAKSIRQLEAPFKNLPLLAFSSSTLSRSKRFREAGFNGFLPKPIRREKLIKMIEWLLGMAEEDVSGVQAEEIVTQHTLTEEGKHSVHILLVEDNAINLKLALFMLEKAGYKLTIAENGQQAIEIYTANPESYDLILMDVQMPVMDGKTATGKLRQMGYKDIAIVAMTADAMKGDREKCLAAGMNDYIPKPIKRDEVFKIVKKWCLDRDK